LLTAGLSKAAGRRPTARQFADALTSITPAEWADLARPARLSGHLHTPLPAAPRAEPAGTRRTATHALSRRVIRAFALALGVIVGVLVAVLLMHLTH
jgi:hypothetical protein